MFTAEHLGSLERYDVGFHRSGDDARRRRRTSSHRAMPVVLTVGLGVFATLAFTGHYVP